jgi:hypothetical protein
MRAALSTLTDDPMGVVHLTLLQESRWRDQSRRVTRVKTLDGGVAVADGGYSAGDRTLRLTWRSRADIDDRVTRMLALYRSIQVSLPDGCYRGVLDKYDSRSGKSTLTVLITEQVSA